MSRGNNRGDIYLSDQDRRMFLAYLGETVRRFSWVIHEFVLMTNHFHIVIETPEPTLSRGMHWLNQSYAQWFNRRHDRVGHLFQGRFKGFLIEKESYLLEVLRYVVLNPVRAHMVERPEEYEWSSYRAKIGTAPVPQWLAPQWTLAQFGGTKAEQQKEYQKFVDEGAGIERSPFDDLTAQLFLGSAEWIDKMRSLIDEKPRNSEHPAEQRYAGRPRANTILETVSEVFYEPADEIRNGHGGVERMAVAWLGCYEGMERLGAIAASLRLRSTSRVSALIRKCDREIDRDPMLRVAIDSCLHKLRQGRVRVPIVHRQSYPATPMRA